MASRVLRFLDSLTARNRRVLKRAADKHLMAVSLDRPPSTLDEPLSLCTKLLLHTPAHSTEVSRRVRSGELVRLYEHMLTDQLLTDLPANYFVIDSKGLPIAAHSTDRHATLGPCDGYFARGYRVHALVDRYEQVWALRVSGMNEPETNTAIALINAAAERGATGLLLADRGYDAGRVFDHAESRGLVMLALRRVSRDVEPDPTRSPARFRSYLILEKFPSAHRGISRHFAQLRDSIERYFAHLCGRSGGLTGLPPWVRTLPRVRTWVFGKVVLHALRRRQQLQAALAGGQLALPTPLDAEATQCSGSEDQHSRGRPPSPLSNPPLAPLEGHIAPGLLAGLRAADLFGPPEAA